MIDLKKAVATIGLTALLQGCHKGEDPKPTPILNLSFQDYLSVVGKKANEFDVRSVSSWHARRDDCMYNLGVNTKREYPSAEVVVNFQGHPDNWKVCYGVALVPKQ